MPTGPVPLRELSRNYDATTMAVRDVEEVIDELMKMLIKKLPGGQERRAVWTTVCEAKRTIEFAKFCLAEDEKDEKRRKEKHPALTHRAWEYHGHIYAMSGLIRRVADEMGVSNFKYREVPVAEDRVGVEGQGQVDAPGPGEAGQAG